MESIPTMMAKNSIGQKMCSAINIEFVTQVALLSDMRANDSVFQRTAVHRNSYRPFFDHRFTFNLCGNELARIQLAVWHRDREFK